MIHAQKIIYTWVKQYYIITEAVVRSEVEHLHHDKPISTLLHPSTWSVLACDLSGGVVFFDFSSRLSKLFLKTSGRLEFNSNVVEFPVEVSLL